MRESEFGRWKCMRAVLLWAAGIVVLLLLGWGLVHAFISPVNPSQEPPDGHVTWPCWTCHIVSESVEVREP
jgi:hypothetical protein